jgi:hypothetical protein
VRAGRKARELGEALYYAMRDVWGQHRKRREAAARVATGDVRNRFLRRSMAKASKARAT